MATFELRPAGKSRQGTVLVDVAVNGVVIKRGLDREQASHTLAPLVSEDDTVVDEGIPVTAFQFHRGRSRTWAFDSGYTD